MIYWPNRTPDTSLTYGIDWAPALGELDDATITESTWEVVSGDAEISLPYRGDTETSVRVTGGVHKQEQILRNTITTSGGDTLEELCYQLVKNLG